LKITIRDIAKLTGVSRGTVDKVLHNRSGVSAEVRSSVKKVIEETGYKPNRAAKTLFSTKKTTSLAVIMPKLTNLYFMNLKEGMEKALTKLQDYNIEIEYFYSDDKNSQEMLSILDYLLEKSIDGMAIRGIENDEICKKIDKFQAKGIPVITFDSDLPSTQRFCFIGPDNLASGRIAASLLAKSIGGKGKVAILFGSSNVTTHVLRIKGFSEYLKQNYPDIEIAAVEQTLDQSVIAGEMTSKIIEKNPDLKGIFNTANCTTKIAQVIGTYNKAEEIKLVTYNLSPTDKTLLKTKAIDFSIYLAPDTQGRLTIETLINLLVFNDKPQKAWITTPIYIAIDENAESLPV
jgi:LacI family transcriptional regulator